MVGYMGLLAFPEFVTKGIAAGVTVVLTAYLGAETVWNIVAGWVEMVEEANAATTFWELRAAGERYGKRVGAQTARILVMVVTVGLAEGGELLSRVMRLPKAAQASAALASDTGGKLVLADVGQVSGARVAETGVTVVLAPAAESALQATGMAMAGKGTAHVARKADGDCDERPEDHHIATDKNMKADTYGGPWTPRFERLFKRARMNLKDAPNIVRVKGHKGPHPEEYHDVVFDRLSKAVDGCPSPEVCRERLLNALQALAKEIVTAGSDLNRLVTRGCK
jgi:hypothetical protein